MGMSASQARFLQLTARKSNVEYQAQRINFERLQLSDKASRASIAYNEKMSNRKLTYSYNSGESTQTVDITYNNYKNYMNQQMKGLSTASQKIYLVSSSGKKIIVANKDEMQTMIDSNKDTVSRKEIENAKEKLAALQSEGRENEAGSYILRLSSVALEDNVESYSVSRFTENDFQIVDGLDNVESFQRAIKDGIYYFATFDQENENGPTLKTQQWDSIGAGAISEVYDKTDDAIAQSEYDRVQSKIQSMDKKLELKLDQLNTEREAITTEMESVQKVLDDNIESSFKVFS